MLASYELEEVGSLIDQLKADYGIDLTPKYIGPYGRTFEAIEKYREINSMTELDSDTYPENPKHNRVDCLILLADLIALYSHGIVKGRAAGFIP